MTSGQWNIVAMLAIVGIIQASDAQIWGYIKAGQNVDVGIQNGLRFGHIPGFLFGSFLLVWMAAILPRLSAGIAGIVLLLVVLSHADKIGTFIQFQPSQKMAQGG